MDYFITKRIAEDGRGKAQLQEIAGPFRTVTQLIEALDTLLTHYSRKFAAKRAAKRYVWWIEESAVQHNLILEELPPDRARW
jgi:hypothetical protein